MLREVKGLVRLNAINRDGDLDYVRWLSKKGQKDRHTGQRWRLIKRLRRRRWLDGLSKSAER